jgi:nucleoid-associated protein YgaU
MEKIFCGVLRITSNKEYDLLKSYINILIDEATSNGYLSEPGADNEFTREIARLGKIGALYETEVLHLPKRAINPLVLEIENESSVEKELTVEEEDESVVEEEPIFEKEDEIVPEKEFDFDDKEEIALEVESTPEEAKPAVFEIKNVLDEEPKLIEQIEESDEFDSEKKATTDLELQTICRNCQYYNEHYIYRKKCFRNQKRQNQLKIMIYFLLIFLVAAFGYIAHIHRFTIYPSAVKSSFQVNKTGLETVKNTASEPTGIIIDTLIQVESPAEKEVTGGAVIPVPTAGSKQVTVTAGQRLTSIALDEYGDKAFWIYIYMENKSILSNPDVLPVGVRISLPPAEKYGIDNNDPASVQRAIDLASEFL